MNEAEIDLVRRALELLNRLVPDVQGRAGDPTPRRCAVTDFAKSYLISDPAADVSCGELWTFFREIADAGGLPPVRKAAFLRQLPAAMATIFGARKCHAIQRGGHRVRGFRGVNLRLDASPPAAVELEAEVE